MSASEQGTLIEEQEYLSGERDGEIRHEFVNGTVHAMAGSTNAQNRIASSVLGLLHAALRGKPCRPYNSDTKVRIRNGEDCRYYYPDVMVVCKENPPSDTFQDWPAAILSRSFRIRPEGSTRKKRRMPT